MGTPVPKNKTGHSGYPIFSDRVIRVIQNLGNENCYPILVPKNTTRNFGYPLIRVRVRVFPIYLNFQKTTHYTKFQ
jgi:hypothetical protein